MQNAALRVIIKVAMGEQEGAPLFLITDRGAVPFTAAWGRHRVALPGHISVPQLLQRR